MLDLQNTLDTLNSYIHELKITIRQQEENFITLKVEKNKEIKKLEKKLSYLTKELQNERNKTTIC